MNIALFSDSYLPTKSGIVTVVIQLRKILEELGHHVVIVTVSNGHTSPEMEADQNLYRMKSVISPVGNDQYAGIPNNKDIVRFLKKHNIELIHSHTEFSVGQAAIKAGKTLNVPVIASTHTMWEDYYKYYLTFGKLIPTKIIRNIVKDAYKNFYAYINVSKKARDYFKRNDVCPKVPSTIIPNAIDTKKFITKNFTDEDKIQIRKKYGLSENDKIVLYVGRVVEEKRVLELLETARKFVTARENIKMVFVGAGAPLNTMKKRVNKYGLQNKILFTGFVNWFEVAELYAIGDIFITVSLSEMHSMTILEAMNLGLPCVCRKDTSFADTVFDGENGYCCDTDEEVAQKVLYLCDNKELCKKMREKSLEVASRFTLELHGKRTESFYKLVLENYPSKITDEMLENAVKNI